MEASPMGRQHEIKVAHYPISPRLRVSAVSLTASRERMASEQFHDAYVKYLTQFPTLASLGTDAAAWLAELNAVSPEAFDALFATSGNVEGGNIAGQRNFPAMQKVRALHAVRATRDPDYTNPYSEAPPEPMAGKRIGSIIRLGY